MAGWSPVVVGSSHAVGLGLGVNVVTDPQFAGGAIPGQNSSAQIQAAVNAGGHVVFPGPGPWIFQGVTIAGGALKHVSGQGKLNTILKLPDGAAGHMFTMANDSSQPSWQHLGFDGNKANNPGGLYDLINLADQGGAGYIGALLMHMCELKNAPRDNIHGGLGRNLGRLSHVDLGYAGRDNILVDGADWVLDEVLSGQAGRACLHSIHGAGIRVKGGVYTHSLSDYGIWIEFDTIGSEIIGPDIDGGQKHGIFYDNWPGGENFRTVPNQHRLEGAQFFNNSQAGTGLYSDILVHGVYGLQVVDCSFSFYDPSNTVPKHHIEEQNLAHPSTNIQAVGSGFVSDNAPGASGGKLTYGTSFSNVVDLYRQDRAVSRSRIFVPSRNQVSV